MNGKFSKGHDAYGTALCIVRKPEKIDLCDNAWVQACLHPGVFLLDETGGKYMAGKKFCTCFLCIR